MNVRVQEVCCSLWGSSCCWAWSWTKQWSCKDQWEAGRKPYARWHSRHGESRYKQAALWRSLSLSLSLCLSLSLSLSLAWQCWQVRNVYNVTLLHVNSGAFDVESAEGKAATVAYGRPNLKKLIAEAVVGLHASQSVEVIVSGKTAHVCSLHDWPCFLCHTPGTSPQNTFGLSVAKNVHCLDLTVLEPQIEWQTCLCRAIIGPLPGHGHVGAESVSAVYLGLIPYLSECLLKVVIIIKWYPLGRTVSRMLLTAMDQLIRLIVSCMIVQKTSTFTYEHLDNDILYMSCRTFNLGSWCSPRHT